MKQFAVVSSLLMVAWLMGCATTKNAGTTTANLHGAWQLTLPTGTPHTVRLISAGGQLYQLQSTTVDFNGTYEHRGNRLVMVKPLNPRLTKFAWKIDSANHLILIKEPSVSLTGAHYRNATLQRGN